VNIKKGLNRIWVVVSALWVVGILVSGIIMGMDKEGAAKLFFFGIICLFVWWGLLYIGFWISSGFSGDDKRKGETDE
jgi:hypothetical protein